MNRPLDFQCPSSNCTWPAFNTLALCSDCQDVTASTQVQELEQECDGSDIISAAYVDKEQNFLNCSYYTFTTPGGGTLTGVVALQNDTGRYANGTFRTSVVSTQVVVSNFIPPGSRNYSLGNDIDWSLVTVVNIAKFKWNETWSLDRARQMMTTAFNTTQCSLTWCLKNYSGVSVVSDRVYVFCRRRQGLGIDD
jgi:hypothetical protein